MWNVWLNVQSLVFVFFMVNVHFLGKCASNFWLNVNSLVECGIFG